MNPIEEQILAIIDKTNGRATYRSVYDELPSDVRGRLPKAMKSLKSQGIAMNQNRKGQDGKRVFEIFRLTGQTGGS